MAHDPGYCVKTHWNDGWFLVVNKGLAARSSSHRRLLLKIKGREFRAGLVVWWVCWAHGVLPKVSRMDCLTWRQCLRGCTCPILEDRSRKKYRLEPELLRHSSTHGRRWGKKGKNADGNILKYKAVFQFLNLATSTAENMSPNKVFLEGHTVIWWFIDCPFSQRVPGHFWIFTMGRTALLQEAVLRWVMHLIYSGLYLLALLEACAKHVAVLSARSI